MTTRYPLPPRRPLVAVVHDLGSASPLTVRAAAGRTWDVAFVCDFALPQVAADREALALAGAVIDVTGQGPDERAAGLAELAPQGITTFSEHRIRETAQLAARLGLGYHDPDTAAVLTDKRAQRLRLARAGVDATRSELLGPQPRAALRRVGLPAVVKPQTGAGSRHTYRIASAEELERVTAQLPDDLDFVVESLLRGDPAVAGDEWGDYVSVESVHTPAGSQQVCVTGKFPLAEPFRETGMMLPNSLPAAWNDAVLSLEAEAVAALGVHHGITHTEIKLTPQGPRLIEVNGRLGGYVPEILKRAAGIDLVRVALANALGIHAGIPRAQFHGVTFQYFLTPPVQAQGVLERPPALGSLRALPGVVHVDLPARSGQRIDWRDGTQGHLGVVYGAARDHATVASLVARVDHIFRTALRDSLRTPLEVTA